MLPDRHQDVVRICILLSSGMQFLLGQLYSYNATSHGSKHVKRGLPMGHQSNVLWLLRDHVSIFSVSYNVLQRSSLAFRKCSLARAGGRSRLACANGVYRTTPHRHTLMLMRSASPAHQAAVASPPAFPLGKDSAPACPRSCKPDMCQPLDTSRFHR
jgi:hypothetical protein